MALELQRNSIDQLACRPGSRQYANPVSLARHVVESVLAPAGIMVNGPSDHDIQVHDDRFYGRVLLGGSLGLGGSYMDKWWDIKALDVFFARMLARELPTWISSSFPQLSMRFLNRLTNLQLWRAYHIGRAHYDIGNDLYQLMLGESMAYSCGYWRGCKTLEQAQEAKLDLVCRKLRLRSGQRVLDVGCGWGCFARHAAMYYGVSVVGLTVSQQQARLAEDLCKGLPVDIRYIDYRQVNETFDHVVSIGMFEHVGYKNYGAFFDHISRCLHKEGLFLLHTIGSNSTTADTDPWIAKYIFPDSKIPSLAQISVAAEDRFIIEDVENFGADYDLTLMAWYRNFELNWPLLSRKYGERFFRMWRYYLLMCAGAFRARRNQVWQLVLSRTGVPGGYRIR